MPRAGPCCPWAASWMTNNTCAGSWPRCSKAMPRSGAISSATTPPGPCTSEWTSPCASAPPRRLEPCCWAWIPTNFPYPFLRGWPTPSRTAETFLVRRDGQDILHLSDVRGRPGMALKMRVPLTRSDVPAVRAVLGVRGNFEGPDYSGVPVFAVARRVRGTQWFLVAKIDADEVRGPIARRCHPVGHRRPRPDSGLRCRAWRFSGAANRSASTATVTVLKWSAAPSSGTTTT